MEPEKIMKTKKKGKKKREDGKYYTSVYFLGRQTVPFLSRLNLSSLATLHIFYLCRNTQKRHKYNTVLLKGLRFKIFYFKKFQICNLFDNKLRAIQFAVPFVDLKIYNILKNTKIFIFCYP